MKRVFLYPLTRVLLPVMLEARLREQGEGGGSMKSILVFLTAALVMAAMIVAMSMPAFAAIDEGPGKGNPDRNPAGKCPGGQNKDTSPGGQKKC
jgi:hypothetical protein